MQSRRTNPQVLTAREGADRVARRHRARASATDGVNEDDPGYSCEQCGSNDFLVEQSYTQTVRSEWIVDCDCDHDEQQAALRVVEARYSVARCGQLDLGHRVDGDQEEVTLESEEEVAFDVHCQSCLDDADQYSWQHDAHQDEVEESEHNFTVRCASCRHEIEFGWSHPDRGGRFWPCEAADFNPWKSWPEPRFRADWARRGWLRPMT